MADWTPTSGSPNAGSPNAVTSPGVCLLNRAIAAYVFVYGAIAAWAPYLSAYYHNGLGIPIGETGLLMALTSAVALMGSPIWGTIHDRFPHSRVLLPLAAVIASAGAYGLFAAGPTFMLPVSAAVWAAGGSGLGPMMDVRVLEMAGADRTRYARVRMWGSVSFIILAPLIGLLTVEHGLQALFWVMIPLLLLGGLACLLLPGRTNVIRTASMRRAPSVVLGHRPIGLFLLGSFMAWVAMSAQNGFFTIYLIQLGASSEMAGIAWSLAALLEVPTMFLFPALARRFGLERLLIAGAVIVASRQIANVLFLDPRILLVCSLLQGLGYSLLLIGSITYISHQAPRGTAATAQGLFNAVAGSLAAIVGAGVGGQLAGPLSVRGLYAVAACMGTLSAILIAVVVLWSARLAVPGSTVTPFPARSPSPVPIPSPASAPPPAGPLPRAKDPSA
jgi:PPP family 3-phenylpropionic acid transporter